MRITSDNRKWYREATIMLSTIRLPILIRNKEFESCLFHKDGDSEAIARYETFEEAVEGHEILRKRYGLK